MDKELKAKWVAALRSGDYQQGGGALRCNNSFCCLGVLLEAGNIKGWDHHLYYGNPNGFDDEQAENIGGYELKDKQTTLQNMNDTLGYSFDDIADYIEENL